MARNSSIEWTHHTFNPWWGCQKVSPGCDHCYAEALDKRFKGGVHWGPHAPRKTFGDVHWKQPLSWNAAAQAAGERARVFCASMADVFDPMAPQGARDRLWTVIRETPHLDWLLLTKRIGNAEKMLPLDWHGGYPNVWLLSTVVNQNEVDRDIPKLIGLPAVIHGLSVEPMLGPIVLGAFLHGLNWVICGGESGHGARPLQPAWVRVLRDECSDAGVAFFFKQWGAWAPVSNTGRDASDADALVRLGKKRAGRLLDGRTWNEFPQSNGAGKVAA